MKNSYLVTVYAHDRVGLLLRLSQLVARKNLNIDRLTLNESAVPGVTLISLVIRTDNKTIQTLVKLLEKQIEVLQAYHAEEPVRKTQFLIG
ncbi:MAG: ACT domain-containing protein [Bacteroidota bacterium]